MKKIRWLLCGVWAVSGCAWSRTEFKVLKAPPLPLPVAAATSPVPSSTPESTPAGFVMYKVQPGESLWRICRRLLGNPALCWQVARENQIADPDLVQPGRELRLHPAAGAQPVLVPPAPVTPVAASAAALEFPKRPNTAFYPGEKLTFSVEYFGIAAGIATLEVEAGPAFHDRPTLHLIATARTHPAFEWIFKVRDRIESFFDREGLFPWQYEKHLREGGYSADSVMLYHQDKRQVVKDEGRTTISAPAWVQDVISEFYYFRTLTVNPGEEVKIPVVADNGNYYDLRVQALRIERVSVPAGTFECLVVEPYLSFEGLFQHKGKLHIWLTRDARHVPVLVKSAIVIGTIDIVLREATVVEE